MKKILVAFYLMTLTSFSLMAEEAETELTAEEIEQYQVMQEFEASLNKQTGTIYLNQANVELNVPEGFFYLSPSDSNKVLVDFWGNPPGTDTLGMLFPSNQQIIEGTGWGMTIEYEDSGYVSDEDAQDIDYAEMLSDMKSDTRAWNKERIAQGYEPIQLVGWAAQPKYDSFGKKLHWAKEIKFGDAEENTLNYNIRILGRKGVLVMNFIASMEQLSEIEQQIDSVMNIANFKAGNTYAEFDPEYDKIAAYGIGALVAGKVAAKAGFFGVILLFLKKFWFLVIAAFVGLGKLFGRKKDDDMQA